MYLPPEVVPFSSSLTSLPLDFSSPIRSFLRRVVKLVKNPVLLSKPFARICPHPLLSKSSCFSAWPYRPGKITVLCLPLQDGTLINNAFLGLSFLSLQRSSTDIFSFDSTILKSRQGNYYHPYSTGKKTKVQKAQINC